MTANQDRPIVGEEFTSRLHRHVINLMCRDSGDVAMRAAGGKPKLYNFSAFVVELDGLWFCITAGHIFDDLKKAKKGGAIISDWNIDDSTLVPSPNGYAYPIDLDMDKVLYFHDDVKGMDYAAFPLRDLTVKALRQQGIVPITEELWVGKDLRRYPLWILVGTPEIPVTTGSSQPMKTHVTIALTPRDDVPDGFEATLFERWYADLDWDSVEQDGRPDSVDGMSGGPIFVLSSSSPDYEYKVLGVQSARNNSGSIAFCALPPFLKALKDALQGIAAKGSVSPTPIPSENSQ